jgi:hypothetical protein
VIILALFALVALYLWQSCILEIEMLLATSVASLANAVSIPRKSAMFTHQ